MSNIDSLKAELMVALPRDRQKIERAFVEADIDLVELLENFISVSEKNGTNVKDLVKSYSFLINEANKEQIYFFKKHCHYRITKHDDFRNDVYFQNSYMSSYMSGVAISAILWPQHKAIYGFFKECLGKIDLPEQGSYLEIGSGHGIYSYKVLSVTNLANYSFVDISDTSIRLTMSMLEKWRNIKSITFHVADFMTYPAKNKYDFIVAGEVLQALEAPVTFMKKIHNMLNSNSYFYFTTPINSPMPDCIYQFKDYGEVEDMIKSCNFFIVSTIKIPYQGYTIEQCRKESLPINIAYLLRT